MGEAILRGLTNWKSCRTSKTASLKPALHFGDPAQRAFDAVQELCEWRMGRAGIATSPADSGFELVEKSIPRWSQRGGRQGYLEFVYAAGLASETVFVGAGFPAGVRPAGRLKA